VKFKGGKASSPGTSAGTVKRDRCAKGSFRMVLLTSLVRWVGESPTDRYSQGVGAASPWEQ